jgi:ABC-2 type transport system permease protein
LKPAADSAALPRPRQFSGVNARGLWALFRRDVMRFLRLGMESLGGPAASSLLFMAVFVLASGRKGEIVPGLPLADFIAPGVVIFSLSHAAYQAAAFSLLEDKLEGIIGDLLAAPLSPAEILAGYLSAAAFNALVAGTLVLALTLLFADLEPVAPAVSLGFATATALLFAQIGVLAALWAERWEHYSVAENFLVLPLGFLSGTFFTITALPPPAQALIALNPVFYAIDGFRYGLTGHAESSLVTGALFLAAINIVLGLIAWRLIAVGYKIKP